jgi:hypothetical protein
MSLPELFRHQTTFIGCLTIRRAAPLSRGMDARAATELTAFLLRHAQQVGAGKATQHVFIATQAYNDPLADTCSALAENKLCTLHDSGKPLACRSVPLEATLPDAFQLSVLQDRARDARFMGADCIRPRAEPDSAPGHLPVIVEGPRVVDREARRAVELRRAALRLDRLHWGDRVFQALRRDLFDHPDRVLTLPEQGYLCMSLAPALSVLSSVSNALTRRVVEYLNAQIELVALTVGAPAKEPTQAQRELAGMLRANVALRARLQAAPPLPEAQPGAAAVEAWLAAEQDPEGAHG